MGHIWVTHGSHMGHMGHMGFIHGSQMCRAAYHVITMMHLAKKYKVNPLIIKMLHLAVTLHPILTLFLNFHNFHPILTLFLNFCVKKSFFCQAIKKVPVKNA